MGREARLVRLPAAPPGGASPGPYVTRQGKSVKTLARRPVPREAPARRSTSVCTCPCGRHHPTGDSAQRALCSRLWAPFPSAGILHPEGPREEKNPHACVRLISVTSSAAPPPPPRRRGGNPGPRRPVHPGTRAGAGGTGSCCLRRNGIMLQTPQPITREMVPSPAPPAPGRGLGRGRQAVLPTLRTLQCPVSALRSPWTGRNERHFHAPRF